MADGHAQRSTQEQVPPRIGAEQPGTRAEQPKVPAGAPAERTPAEEALAEAALVPHPSPPAAIPAYVQKSAILGHVENILEEDLAELYKRLSPHQRKQFKNEGERTARKIEQLLKKATTTIMEIIRLVRRWLRLLPGANVFFIEQEAKIKAERIMSLKK